MVRVVLRIMAMLALALAQQAGVAELRIDQKELRALLQAERFGAEAVAMAPDGKHFAEFVGTRVVRVVLITDLEAKVQRPLRRPDDLPTRRPMGPVPLAMHWVGNDILVIDYDTGHSLSFDASGKRLAVLGERFIARVATQGERREQVLVYRDAKFGAVDLVDARSGERRGIRFSMPGRSIAWAFDAEGVLRAVTMADRPSTTKRWKLGNWYRASEQAPWQLLEEWPEPGPDTWVPLFALPEPGMLAVMSRRDRDTRAVVRYDAEQRKHLEPIASHPTEDILHVVGLQAGQAKGFWTDGMKPTVFWSDARWTAIQAAVDAALPDRVNVVSGNESGNVLVHSLSDGDPGRWYVLDTKTSKMFEAKQAFVMLTSLRMRPMTTMNYRARDGLTIPAYLTRPAGDPAKPVPTVVLIHGGPHTRDHWTWSREVQILALAGYAVFQPQFRGSSGFGRRFQEAGYRQWGRAMQDDISDGVRHLVDQGIADPERVCIFGASYGGYAALWGAIRTPELYRCAISLAGVSDPAEFASGSLFDDSTPVVREIWQQRIGDPVKDREWLDEVSPLKHAARAKVPLLIAHGEEDRRVLPSQSEAMVNALRAAQRPVDWLPLPGEGHALAGLTNRERFFRALLEFLDRHIGAHPPQAAASAVAAPSQ